MKNIWFLTEDKLKEPSTDELYESFHVYLNDIHNKALKSLKAQVINKLKETGAYEKIEALDDCFIEDSCIEWGIKRLLDYSIIRECSTKMEFSFCLYGILMAAFCDMLECNVVFRRECLADEYDGSSADIIDQFSKEAIEEFLKPRAEVLEYFGITQFIVTYKSF